MDDQPNPYESPKTESRLERPAEPPQPQPGDGWKFVLLGIAILCGLVSFVPWLAVIFAVISSPVFVRYFVLRQKASNGTWPQPGTVVAGMVGEVGLGFGILAAAAGAFLGVCSVTAWGAMFSALTPNYEQDIQLGLALGVVLGFSVFLLISMWLLQRLWPPRSRNRT